MMKSLIIFFNENYMIILLMFMNLMLMIPMKLYKIHPLNFMLILITLTFLSSLLMNLMTNSWMNFIIILILVGGLMIIFLYIISISNNNQFLIQYKNIIIISIKMLIISIMFIKLTYFIDNKIFLNSQDLWNLNLNLTENNNKMIMSSLFNWNKISTIYIMLYLYYSMLCIMMICLKINLPLRQLFYYE